MFGLFLSGFLSEKIGRKKTLIIAAVLQIVSASSVYFCDCFETLVVVVGLSNLITCMVQVPSYSLLSGKYFSSFNYIFANIFFLFYKYFCFVQRSA